ncbi:hypothetical protein WMY93_028081 [Mugilogobius chulae]|uniref:Endonuclease/exonuclease/phosphatase domain-containing protein n=1 Tax=Mugilogobius chulae TaxID=88201 RepID=A0AAW0N544_9GOBI
MIALEYFFILTLLLHLSWGENGDGVKYSRDFLLLFQNSGLGTIDPLSTFPKELVRLEPTASKDYNKRHDFRKRGRRGGVRQRLKREGPRRIPLPTITLSNIQSLRSKIDELRANVKFLEEYKNSCLLALTETWLKNQDSGTELDIEGFGEPLRLDRDPAVTGKSLGGGVCLYVNKNWCKTVVVRETLCTPDIELLSVSLRPYYLPREFPQLFVSVVYIHPRADADAATQLITNTVRRFQRISPDAPNLVMGDFNHCNPAKSLCGFEQYVTCATRGTKCLDRCYGSIKGAYRPLRRAPLGTSDHDVIYLTPYYQPVLKRVKPERRTIPVWSDDSTLCLQECLECTDWDVFKDAFIVSLLYGDAPDHGPVLSEFFDWCQSSFLHINVAKTKEMCIDFRKSSSVLSPALIDGQVVEVVQEYKYLGVMMDNKLTFESQVDAICIPTRAHPRQPVLPRCRHPPLGHFSSVTAITHRSPSLSPPQSLLKHAARNVAKRLIYAVSSVGKVWLEEL